LTQDPWRSRIRGLVTDPEGRTLVVRSEHGSALPVVEIEGFADNELESVRTAFAELLGLRVAVLRYVAREIDREARHVETTYALEAHGDAHLPEGALWLGVDALAAAQLPEDDRAPLRAHFQSVEPTTRAPWARAGWLAEASEWIEESLAELNRAPTGPVEQVRTWALSAVLRVPTSDGSVFFKATVDLPLFVDEGRVMRGLARLFPRNVPRPLALDRRRRWMLLEDAGQPLGWDAPTEERERVLHTFGLMQATAARDIDALLAIGCVERRPEWLAREVGLLLADDAALTGLDEEEIARLRADEPLLVALCKQLAASSVPSSIAHGDLHLGNVARTGDSYVFFDWSDACVTHPFLDLIDVFREEDAVTRDALRDAYLRAWVDYGSHDQLLSVWRLAEPLASLNQAVSYRYIASGVAPGTNQELDWAIPHWLRNVLAADLRSLSS
jgi:Phosphotransferase enzyme family